MESILITGALGQLGLELIPELQNKFGSDCVYATDIKMPNNDSFKGNFSILDVTNDDAVLNFIEQHAVTQIYHLAAILSANAEKSPKSAWHINVDGLLNILEIAKETRIKKIFWPSSIAVFGPDTPQDHTPQQTVMNPNSVYGITKVTGENLCAYYNTKFDMDIRSLRYPGLIGYNSMPGGGTTDYAVEIFHDAINTGTFTCPISADTKMPMMFMPDAVRATLELMEAERNDLRIKTSYNLSGVSFSPKELADIIQSYFPEFEMKYDPNFREEIASSWPNSIDDAFAQKDWNWKAAYNLIAIADEMICRLKKNLKSVNVF
jgi:nucleoside-diphosphate-sugar epimerase